MSEECYRTGTGLLPVSVATMRGGACSPVRRGGAPLPLMVTLAVVAAWPELGWSDPVASAQAGAAPPDPGAQASQSPSSASQDQATSAPQEVVVTAERLNQARAGIQTQTGASTYTIDSAAIQALPGGESTSLNQVVLQAPDVALDSFGQIHVRGEHNGLQYRLNGIILPEGISVFSQTLDPHLIESLQLITGALPAEYGLRTAGIIDLTTKSGVFDPHGSLTLYGGSHNELYPSLFAGGSEGSLNYFVTADFLRSNLGIESPYNTSTPPHDETKQYHGFGYFEYIVDPDDRVSAVLGTSHGEFQIPNTPGLTPTLGLTVDGESDYPSTALNEHQTEITQFGILSYQHAQGALDLQSSFSARYTSLTFFPDPLGDLLYNGIAQNAYKRDVAYAWQTDASYHLGAAHTLRAGVYLQHDRADSDTLSQVLAVSPVDPLTGLQTQLSDIPLQVADNGSATQNIESAYLQDEWQALDDLTVNYGLRFDHLAAYTSGQQLGPRLNVVWKPVPGMTVHGGYSRYFSPPPFELIGSKSIAKFAGTTGAPAVQTDDAPLPERANYYDLGVQQRLTRELTVGLDTFYKQSTDLIDEGQFGAPIILTPFNYRYGLQYGAELTLGYTRQGFSAYANLATQRAKGKDIVSSQFNFAAQDLQYIAGHFISLDHEQRVTGSAGISYQLHDTRVSLDALLGSGLRENLPVPQGVPLGDGLTTYNIPNGAHLPYYGQVNFGISQSLPGLGLGSPKNPATVRFDVINLLDAQYQIRNGTGVGVGAPQWGPRRGFFGGITLPF